MISSVGICVIHFAPFVSIIQTTVKCINVLRAPLKKKKEFASHVGGILKVNSTTE